MYWYSVKCSLNEKPIFVIEKIVVIFMIFDNVMRRFVAVTCHSNQQTPGLKKSRVRISPEILRFSRKTSYFTVFISFVRQKNRSHQ